MRIIVCCWLVWFSAVPSLFSAQPAPPQERILIWISLDAFRWDYLEKFHPPNLTRLATEGVHAKRLISVFPSMTFPNHYTMATGLWPEHHGIIHNGFYDPVFKERFAIFNNPGPTDGRWWGGEPIWVTAVKQGRTADCLYWPGTAAEIDGVRPTEWKLFDADTEPDECVDLGLRWLDKPAGQLPNLVMLYFHQPDTVGHHSGPDSPEMTNTVAQVDHAMGRLLDGIHRLNLDDKVNIIITSDHGMAAVSTNRQIVLPNFVDMNKVQVDFTGAVAGLWALDKNVDALYAAFAGKVKHCKVYRREDTPARYHFRHNRRIPDIILVADEGWYINKRDLSKSGGRNFEKGTHGYDPRSPNMGATFIAWGPAFRHHRTIGPVENIHMYDLLCATLGLKPAPNDGDERLAKKVLLTTK